MRLLLGIIMQLTLDNFLKAKEQLSRIYPR